MCNIGSIIAVSYEARAAGVQRIMRGLEAKKTCPELILITVPVSNGKADISIYRDAGQLIVDEILKKLGSSCIIEKASIDEVYIDLTQAVTDRLEIHSKLENGYDILKNIASNSLIAGQDLNELKMSKNSVSKGHIGQRQEVIDDNTSINFGMNDLGSEDIRLLCGAAITSELRLMIKNKLGFSSSGGVAHNKMLAKIAGSMHKPAKQTIVPRSIVQTLMDNIPISRVPGFGGKFGKELAEFGDIKLITFKDILKIDINELNIRFGEEIVNRIVNSSKGIDYDLVKDRSNNKSFGSGKNFTFANKLTENSMKDGTILKHLLGNYILFSIFLSY